MITLYDLLAKSLLRIVYPKVVIEDTTIITSVNNKDFVSKGSVIVNEGWYSVDALPDKINILPAVTENANVSCNFSLQKGETQPPKRYTEPALINAMELAGQHFEDEEAKSLFKQQKKGLGTDATRVSTIEGLYKRGYIVKKR